MGKETTTEHIFQAEVNSRFEPILIERVFEPLLERLPRSVLPSTISVIGHIICWTGFVLAALSPHLSPPLRALALVGCGFMIFFAMTADCLDGMQARRTGRCSPVGELLDHWLDSVNVPMVTAGLGIALEFEPWLLVLIHLTNGTIYNAQLTLYHRSGRFVHPPTSGVDAQFGTSFGYLALAVYLSVWGPNFWVNLALGGLATMTQLRLNFFYWQRLKQDVRFHLPFIVLCAAYSALYLLRFYSSVPYVLLLTLLSMRVTGNFVIYTLTKRPYLGIDVGAVVSLGGLTAVGLLWPAYGEPAAWSVLGYFALHSVIDFVRAYSRLQPRA
jgi:phosphatidylglycerophosphate synthase